MDSLRPTVFRSSISHSDPGNFPDKNPHLSLPLLPDNLPNFRLNPASDSTKGHFIDTDFLVSPMTIISVSNKFKRGLTGDQFIFSIGNHSTWAFKRIFFLINFPKIQK
jgi:hypothetical protein